MFVWILLSVVVVVVVNLFLQFKCLPLTNIKFSTHVWWLRRKEKENIFFSDATQLLFKPNRMCDLASNKLVENPEIGNRNKMKRYLYMTTICRAQFGSLQTNSEKNARARTTTHTPRAHTKTQFLIEIQMLPSSENLHLDSIIDYIAVIEIEYI